MFRSSVRALATGVIAAWPQSARFGFIKSDDSNGDVFLHYKELSDQGIVAALESGNPVALTPGMKVEFDTLTEKGRSHVRAKNVKVLSTIPAEGYAIHARGRANAGRDGAGRRDNSAKPSWRREGVPEPFDADDDAFAVHDDSRPPQRRNDRQNRDRDGQRRDRSGDRRVNRREGSATPVDKSKLGEAKHGVVARFSPKHGWGYITEMAMGADGKLTKVESPNSGGREGDVFVHERDVVRFKNGGRMHLHEGRHVMFYVVPRGEGKSGMRATSVHPPLGDSTSTPPPRAEQKPRSLKVPSEETIEKHKTSTGAGVVRKYDLIQGHGMVKDTGSEMEYFFERKNVDRSLQATLVPNTEVVFTPALSDFGTRALKVKLAADEGAAAGAPLEYKPFQVGRQRRRPQRSEEGASSSPAQQSDRRRVSRRGNNDNAEASSSDRQSSGGRKRAASPITHKAKPPSEAEKALHEKSVGKGTVISVNKKTGFGFVTDEKSGLAYFLHRKMVHNELWATMEKDTAVVFDPRLTQYGLRAAHIMTAEQKVAADQKRKEFLGDGTTCGDGTTIMYTRKDGVVEFHSADGSRAVKQKDGRVVHHPASKEYVVTEWPDGRKVFRYPDGSKVETAADGTAVVSKAGAKA